MPPRNPNHQPAERAVKLRNRRLALGLKQVDVALVAGYPVSEICSWETGYKHPRDPFTFQVIEDALDKLERERRQTWRSRTKKSSGRPETGSASPSAT